MLEGEHLEGVHRFLEFHHRAFTSGNFEVESALDYYRMRHPTRIIVGSDVATTLFVLDACVHAQHFFYGEDGAR